MIIDAVYMTTVGSLIIRGVAAPDRKQRCKAGFVSAQPWVFRWERTAHLNSKPKCFTRRRASDCQAPASTARSSSWDTVTPAKYHDKLQHSTVALHSTSCCMLTDLLMFLGDEVGDDLQARHPALLARPADMHMLWLERLEEQQ